MNKMYRWQFHFNAMHSMTPEKEESKHAHSFLVILCMEVEEMDLDKQNKCETELKQYLSRYNGKYLNEMEEFNGTIPTIEVIGERLYPDTSRIAAYYGLKQVQIEVGDSPLVLYALGERPLFGASYRPLSEESYLNYISKMGL